MSNDLVAHDESACPRALTDYVIHIGADKVRVSSYVMKTSSKWFMQNVCVAAEQKLVVWDVSSLTMPSSFGVRYDNFVWFLRYLHQPSLPLFTNNQAPYTKPPVLPIDKSLLKLSRRVTIPSQVTTPPVRSETQFITFQDAAVVGFDEGERIKLATCFAYSSNLVYPCDLAEVKDVVHCAHWFDCPALIERISVRLLSYLQSVDGRIPDETNEMEMWKLLETVNTYNLNTAVEYVCAYLVKHYGDIEKVGERDELKHISPLLKMKVMKAEIVKLKRKEPESSRPGYK